MTTRVYLSAARVWPGPPETGDLPAERVFVNSGDVADSSNRPSGGNVAPLFVHFVGGVEA